MLKNLNFLDKALENEFVLTRQHFHLISFRNLIVSLVFQATAIYFSNPLGLSVLDLTKLFPFLVSMILTIIFYFLVTKKSANKCSYALSACVLFYILGASEFANYLQKEIHLEPWAYFLLGISIQTGCLFLLVSRIKWTHSLLIISTVNVFSWIRIIDVFTSSGAQKTAIISAIINTILLISITYSSEKGDRAVFQRLKLQAMQLEALEELIKKNIPTAIFILRKEEILFTNDGANNLFNIEDKSQALDIFKKIMIVSQDEKNELRKPKNNDKSLYERIKICGKSIQNGKFEASKNFSCFEGEIRDDASESVSNLSCQIGPTFWKGESSVVVILSDISYIKKHYKNLETYKDHLLATISHDLRTPLNGMLGMLELLMEECRNDSQKQKLLVTMSSAKLLLSMINDILDFSLVSKGKLRLKFEPTNVTLLVEDTIKILRLQAQLKGLELEIQNNLKNSDCEHIIDGNRVRQVLLNLIGNAIKFTEKGKVTIRIREELAQETEIISSEEIIREKRNFNKFDEVISDISNVGTKQLVFEVEDTGIGIRKNEIGSLFKLFSRVNPEVVQNTSGIGLGLAISQSLVCLMNSHIAGANIKVSSVLGKGSIFSFPISLNREPSIIFESIPEFDQKVPLSLEAKTLNTLILRDLLPVTRFDSEGDSFIIHAKKQTNFLVVDDDQINILVAKNYLQSFEEGLQIFTAANGKEALDKVLELAKNKIFFDVILMDCNMPVMDGYEASEKLKSMMNSGNLPYTPIVAITANVGSSDKEKCFASGMDYFITKPYTKVHLFKTIKDALKRG